jgi:hypothetical protein
MAQETVSADSEGKFKCTDFTYLAVTQGTDVSSIESDGLVGLSPSRIGTKN